MLHFLIDGFTLQLDDLGNLNGQINQIELVECDAEAKPEKSKKQQLPYRTLVLHRFLALVVMVLILAVGIILNVIIMSVMT